MQNKKLLHNNTLLKQIATNIKKWGQELGFDKVGICDIDLTDHEKQLQKWLDAGYHGTMDWMARHGMMRARPNELLPGTIRVISVRMNYLPAKAQFATDLENTDHGYISRYALGRDYHKLVRKQLQKLASRIEQEIGTFGYRPFVDSAPILERPLAQKAGLGWSGKHSLLLDQDAGSWFFLGELLVDLPLPVDTPSTNKCGKCQVCITSCPTNAIVADQVVDARRCISYLTIEYKGSIPLEFRDLIGNRIYGCDDCQLVCPWNRFSKITEQKDFWRRDHFNDPNLLTLFSWDEELFAKLMAGSPIWRIGHEQWLRNIAIALGNSAYSPEKITALTQRLGYSKLLDDHITWALDKLQANQNNIAIINLDFTTKIHTKKQRLIRTVYRGLPRDAK